MTGTLILGAGGHGKVVADILMCQDVPVLGFLDDDPALRGSLRLGLPVLGRIDDYLEFAPDGLALGIGSNATRRDILRRLGGPAENLWRNAIHPRATVARSVRLGRGVVIAAGAVINPDTIIEDGVIVNTSASVDHDCVVSAYAHIAPGAMLAGGVHACQGAFIGTGAVVIPGCAVGAWSVVGAGAVVVRNVPDSVTARGVPARW